MSSTVTLETRTPEIGATVKLAEGARGEAVEAEYTLADDDLYVRARIESDEIAPYYAAGNKGPMHPKTAMAWTQPYVAGNALKSSPPAIAGFSTSATTRTTRCCVVGGLPASAVAPRHKAGRSRRCLRRRRHRKRFAKHWRGCGLSVAS